MHFLRLNISKISLDLKTRMVVTVVGVIIFMALISFSLICSYTLQLLDGVTKIQMAGQQAYWAGGSRSGLPESSREAAVAGSSNNFFREAQARFIKLILSLLIVLVAAISLAVRLIHGMLSPVELLSRQTAAMRSGDWRIRLDERQNGSLGELAKSINQMVQQLQYFYRLAISKERELEDLSVNLESIIDQRTETLKQLAITDALTGVYNHRHIMECLAIELELADQYQAPLALAIFDIDFFKQVNDSYGHMEGDKVLTCVAACLQENVRQKDILGRYGGEEFFLILPQTNLAQAYAMVERLRVLVSHLVIGERRIQVTVSAGVAGYKGETMEEFIQRADRSLYHAKESGRNKSVQEGMVI